MLAGQRIGPVGGGDGLGEAGGAGTRDHPADPAKAQHQQDEGQAVHQSSPAGFITVWFAISAADSARMAAGAAIMPRRVNGPPGSHDRA